MNKKEELSEAIHQGINRSIDDINKAVITAIIIVVIILLLFFGFAELKENKCIKDGTCQSPIMASPNCFPLENLHCQVFVINDSSYYSPSFGKVLYYNDLHPLTGVEIDICGYQEADAWFGQMKEDIKFRGSYTDEDIEMRCE